MSSLKDIMDVDVEPLESQAYRRSKEAAEQQEASRRSIISPASATPSPPVDDGKGKAPVRRRRSNRVSKVPGQSATPRSGAGRRRSSATSDAMDYAPTIHAGGSAQESMSGSPRHSSRSSEPAAEMPVKYTPVTGRISRAKKGVPVHTCEICRPAKTFTRAEHLRRHQLSHQKPAYPCTFEDCERAFHRPDLLARHLNRHETQGEKAYRSGDRRSRASSSASENHEPLLKVETPQEDNPTSEFQVSSEHSTTSNPTVSSSEDPTATSQIGRGPGSFDPVNFSASSQSTPSSGGPARRGDGGGTSRPPRSTPPRSTYEQMTSSFSVRPTVENGNQGIYSGHMSQVLEVASETEEPSFPGYPASHVLPNLRIPEDSFLPGLSYTQESSPWCSSASDSTYSTQSDTWIRRGRSASIATIPDWPGQALAAQWPSNPNSTSAHELRSPAFGAIAEHYPTPFTSPGISPSTSSQVLLDVPVFGGYYMESVGTPTLSTVNNSFAQLVPASPSRVSSSRLGSASRRSKELVESQLAGSIPSGLASGHLISSQFDTYLSDYRQFFDPLFPIIHHPTFNISANPLPVLAMVAIGTRYSDRPEARKLGMAIHDHCRRSIDLCATWTLSTMQAILLTEIFERFHGKKPHVRRSQLFEGLYNRILREPCEVWQVQQPQNPALQQSDIDVQWMQWVDAEARRRLFSACFIFDTHQSLYYEQHRSNGQQLDTILSLIYIPCPRKPWDACDSKAWQTEWQTETNNQPNRLVEQFPANDILRQSPFVQALIICFIACQLPTRDPHKIPDQFSPSLANCQPLSLLAELPSTPLANTYLALYHTPLHDLLGVAGDTWVFGRKITPLSAFESTQARLKTWSSSLPAAVATQYACRVLQASLSNTQQRYNGGLFISDYWSLYVSALICWAFGHRYQSGGSGTNSRSNSSMANDRDPKNGAVEAARISALDYTSAMLALSPRELLSSKANMKGETSGIIDAVRTRLEIDGIGSHSMTIVDAIGVLTRLKEVGRGKYF